MIAAIFNLNHPAHVIHWHFLTLSVSNLVVIVVMLIVFALAIALPFPRALPLESTAPSAPIGDER